MRCAAGSAEVVKTSRYLDLAEARRVYAAGGNVTEYLRQARGEVQNSEEIIEIAYDLQAGSYAEWATANLAALERFADEVAAVVTAHTGGLGTFLDAGTGELTTLSVLAARLPGIERLLAFDISWSRLRHGLEFASARMPAALRARTEVFAADIARLPLAAKSVDVVLSNHALEPNGGREVELLTELFRVAKSKLILCEPSFENNSEEGRTRMTRLGYVKDLAGVAATLGATVVDVVRIASTANPLNPTHAYVLDPPPYHGPVQTNVVYTDPGTETPLRKHADCMFSTRHGLAYPILQGIPVLTEDAAFLASALDRFFAPAR